MSHLPVFRSAEEFALTRAGRATVLSVGNFDGVHLGHQKILRRVVELTRAADTEAIPLAVTFDPHPLRFLRPDDAPPLLFTPAQRAAAMETLGIQAMVLLRFHLSFSHLSPEEFVREVIVRQLGGRSLVVGENFRFGHQQAGDVALLRALAARRNIAVESLPPVMVRGRVVSSSAIRTAVRLGRVDLAGRLLGRPFALTGTIHPGTGRGTRQVVPTLNLAPEQEVLPKSGVYITETLAEGRWYRSATNVGVRPTFSGRPAGLPSAAELTIESHLFDFSEELSSGRMEIRFWRRLRDEKRFSGPVELAAQIRRDIAFIERFFRRLDGLRKAYAASS